MQLPIPIGGIVALNSHESFICVTSDQLSNVLLWENLGLILELLLCNPFTAQVSPSVAAAPLWRPALLIKVVLVTLHLSRRLCFFSPLLFLSFHLLLNARSQGSELKLLYKSEGQDYKDGANDHHKYVTTWDPASWLQVFLLNHIYLFVQEEAGLLVTILSTLPSSAKGAILIQMIRKKGHN